MKQTISSQFKYTINLGMDSMRAIFKLRKTKKDVIMHTYMQTL